MENEKFNLKFDFIIPTLRRMFDNDKQNRMKFFNNKRCMEAWFCIAAQEQIDCRLESIHLLPEFSSEDINKYLKQEDPDKYKSMRNWIDILLFDRYDSKKYIVELKYKTKGNNKEPIIYEMLNMKVGSNKSYLKGKEQIDDDITRINLLKKDNSGFKIEEGYVVLLTDVEGYEELYSDFQEFNIDVNERLKVYIIPSDIKKVNKS